MLKHDEVTQNNLANFEGMPRFRMHGVFRDHWCPVSPIVSALVPLSYIR